MIRKHYNEGLHQADMENMVVYQMKVVYTELYLKNADEVKINFYYYATPNGQLLIDLADALIHHSLDIESIEITKI